MAELVEELEPLVVGARVSDVHPLPPRDLLLVLQKPEWTFVRRLRLSANADGPRVHLQHGRVDLHEGPVAPFFERARAELVDSRLKRLSAVRADRIVLASFDETREGRARALLLELFGRHANVALLDGDDRVLDLLIPADPGKRDARLTVGAAWRAPQAAGTAAPVASLRETLAQAPPPPRGSTEAPLSWLVEHHLGAQAERAHHERERKELRERLERKLKRARALEAGLRERASAADSAERDREAGELIKTNLRSIARGADAVELDDYFATPPGRRRIALDPRKSALENAESYFDRYRKLVRGRDALQDELQRALARIDALEQLLQRAAAEGVDLPELSREALERGVLDREQQPDERKRKAPEPRKPYRIFQGLRGAQIRVGRNAADNDDLTFHHARGNDVWLHTADTPGSHVVLVLAGAKEPDAEELLDAAHLAAHFSPLSEARRVRVHVARRKQVHKPRGAKPGLVHLSGGKIVDLVMQPERLKRLLESARRGPAGLEP